MRVNAPAKLNLCLFLGPRRDDGLHELCSLFEPLALADAIEVMKAAGTSEGVGPGAGAGPGAADEVVCPGVEGENLAARALAALREAGWEAPPLRIEIEKRIPVAAGLGGGSADAAAVLRLAAPGPFVAHSETKGPGLDLPALAATLGADVPSQLDPGLALVRGAGERVERLPDPEPHAVVLLPGGGGLSTAEVFAEADRLGLGRDADELERLAGELRAAAGAGASPLAYAELLANDLEPAARSLRPEVGAALDALRAAGAPLALLSGSGPTAVGLFPALARAKSAAAHLDRDDAIVCEAGRAP
ncbi:MAG TPA: 4-(cytidine 5'-diphospho)-2-C-methyl-D-erythritol kinase [Thermoanaerobaculia bacterium]|nr:4-(cytidine 5'-diphospho)-2-C-methyl-D-erythritol kinase [Thermoanaerobaculia bacterium]